MAEDSRLEGRLEQFARDASAALGTELLSVTVYGSAVGRDWIPGSSDVNVALVLRAVTPAVLDALVPVVAHWRARGFALPLVIDLEYLARARDVFAIELDDIARQHRVLLGVDHFAALTGDLQLIRRECEYEARGKLLRLRTLYLAHAESPDTLGRMVQRSFTSFVTLLRHLLRVRGVAVGDGFEAVLTAGERTLGPLPALRAAFARRLRGDATLPGDARAAFAAYLADVERIVTAVDALGA